MGHAPFQTLLRCTVLTDNAALKSLLATPHPSGRLARWRLALQDLDLEIKHRSGKVNQNADVLSRNPIGGQDGALECRHAKRGVRVPGAA